MSMKLRTVCLAVTAFLLLGPPAAAKSPDGRKVSGTQTWIVVLEDEPLVTLMRGRGGPGEARMTEALGASGKTRSAPGGKLDLNTDAARAVLSELDARFDQFAAEAAATLGRPLAPFNRYRVALNGFAASMTATEAERLAALPGVRSVAPDRVIPLHTDAGPEWIGARDIWDGAGFIPESSGEGIIIGIIDSGINWDHVSFGDPGEGLPVPSPQQHDHENPLGTQLGLCSQEEVVCNDKLIGVYDFVEDNPNTDIVEENNNGRDNTNHGTHVAAIAAGNPVGIALAGIPLTLSGVAPNANIVSYRACFDGDGDGGCLVSQIIDAIDQAVLDGVDVLNLSLGGGQRSPWDSRGEDIALLNAVEAGITVVTSAGNDGPGASTLTNPAIAPWTIAVGSATHDRQLTSIVKATEGGDTTPPGDLYGESFVLDGVSITDIVHAGDFGYPLCASGPEAPDVPSCDSSSSVSFPPDWDENTFAGKIVVCDRGSYGRVEKGLNVALAGAAGYILANTATSFQGTDADTHCLPSSHIDRTDGDRLREWLASGTGHRGSITGLRVLNREEVADQLNGFSSRGPNPAVAPNVLKPELIAPGSLIIAAAGDDNSGFIFQSGTSMASPHVAGAAALLKSIHPDWTPRMVASALTTTATDEIATNQVTGDPADRHEVGHGRPRLGDAARAALFLDETANAFRLANPLAGGDPGELNLPSMVDYVCADVCTFTRTVEPLSPGLGWTASVDGFPVGTDVSVTPSNFTLNAGQAQELTVTVDLRGAGKLNEWVFGDVILTANNRPPAVLPVAVFSSAGALPASWSINSDLDAGTQRFVLSGLTTLPQATFNAGGLVEPDQTTVSLVEDLTFNDPYDEDDAAFTVLYDVPAGALWLHAETLASTAQDLDLFVGRDSNGNGRADAFEEVCSSTTPEDLELCDIFSPQAGVWWIRVQNWESGAGVPEDEPQDATLVSALVTGGTDSRLTATGPGRVDSLESFGVDVSWENVNAPPGTTLLGAVGVGTDATSGNDVGVIPLSFQRTGVAAAQPTAVFPGRTLQFALDGGGQHDALFLDIPPSAGSLTVEARGATGAESGVLELALYRRDFDNAFVQGSALPRPRPSGLPLASDSDSPSITLDGTDLQPGRYYVLVRNAASTPVSVTLETTLTHGAPTENLRSGLWSAVNRSPAISQGIEYGQAGNNRAVLWYTYGDDGLPTWYIAAAAPAGDSWTADLLRYTNDGENQFETVVGTLALNLIGQNDAVMTWTLGGVSGSDRLAPTVAQTCPNLGSGEQSFSGIWGSLPVGKGGASVVMNATDQAQVHYLYDATGNPRWLIGAASVSVEDIPLLQFNGQCPTCPGVADDGTVVGTATRDFSAEDGGSWTLDYLLGAPLSGDVERTDSVTKLTNRYVCE